MKTVMNKNVAKGIVLALIMAVMLSLAVPAAASSANQSSIDAKRGVVQIQVWYVDPHTGHELQLSSGTGFLINEETVLTAQHLVSGFPESFYRDWATVVTRELGRERTAKDIAENLHLRINVLRDVYVEATIKKDSGEMDFAVLSLSEKMHDRVVLPLRRSSLINQTESVYALGFPNIVAHGSEKLSYDSDDLTITSGAVNKVTSGSFDIVINNPLSKPQERTVKNVDAVIHGAAVTPGNAGGPLVDGAGNVVGLNITSNDAANMYVAVSMDPIMQILDALGIQYETAEETAVVETQSAEAFASQVTESPVTEPVATEPPATEATVPAQTLPSVVEEEEPGINMTVILVVAAAAVIAVIIVIIIVLIGGKKEERAAYSEPTGAFANRETSAAASERVAPVQREAFTPAEPKPAQVNPAQSNPAQSNSAAASSMRKPAEENTLVLKNGGDEEATTVLGRAVALVRKRDNETITINAERFNIGRDPKTANYCVTDNPSVSRNHAALITKGSVVYLVDLNAANGTFVNGVKVGANHEVALKNGDKIRLADEEFQFRV